MQCPPLVHHLTHVPHSSIINRHTPPQSLHRHVVSSLYHFHPTMLQKRIQSSILAENHLCLACFGINMFQSQSNTSTDSNTRNSSLHDSSTTDSLATPEAPSLTQPSYLAIFTNSNQSKFALLLLSLQLLPLNIIPIQAPCTLKITSETEFALFLRKNKPKIFRFGMERGELWNCVSMIGNIISGLMNQNLPTDTVFGQETKEVSSGSASQSATDTDLDWLKHYDSIMSINGLTGLSSSSTAHAMTRRIQATSPRRMKSSSTNLKEDWVQTQMTARRKDYTETKDINVALATFNVNMKQPSDRDTNAIREWLQLQTKSQDGSIEYPDLIFVGLQEVDMSATAVLKEQTEALTIWDTLLRNALNARDLQDSNEVGDGSSQRPEYVRVCSKQLVGLYSALFVKKSYNTPDIINDVRTCAAGVGVMQLGNKGAVSIRLEFYKSTFCFVNAHLAPHMNNVERRNQNYFDIMKRTLFNGDRRIYHPDKHDFFFWVGDLNYRSNLDYDSMLRLIRERRYETILQHDQLRIEKSKPNSCFPHFDEAPITFPCTYRFDSGTDNYDTSEKRRVPAYTDRILWKQNKLINCRNYSSFHTMKFSDHKPVSALFSVPVQVVIKDQMHRIHSDIIKQLDRMENDMLPEIRVSQTDFRFDDVRFEEVQTQTIVVENVGKIVCSFQFVGKPPNEDVLCKDWVEFDPPAGMIIPNDKVEIQLSVNVQAESAHALNAGRDKIDDILILHLKNGRDHFISIQGNWLKTCMANSMDRLITLKNGVRNPNGDEILEVDKRPWVPRELFTLCKFLHDHGLDTARIFRSEGSIEEARQIRDILDTGGSLDNYQGSCDTIAESILSLLKTFEEPVIPYHYYDRVMETADEGYERCLALVKSIREPLHYNVFVYTISLLREVLKHSKKNDSTPADLAVIFGDAFVRKKDGLPSQYEQQQAVKFVEYFLQGFVDEELGPLKPIQ